MKWSLKTITPEDASILLASNTNNRRLSQRVVDEYAAIMESGGWVGNNGETIKVSESGVLIDGQHRLAACVKSGVPMKCLVVTGVCDDSINTVDVGKRRSHADALYLRGYSDHRATASVSMLVYCILHGDMYARREVFSNQDVVDIAAEHDLTEALSVGNSVSKKIRMNRVYASAFYYVFKMIDPDLTNDFFEKLIHGGNTKNTSDPAILLRERFLWFTAAKRVSRSYEMALIVTAWNKARAGLPCKCLKVAYSNEFPEVAGIEIARRTVYERSKR